MSTMKPFRISIIVLALTACAVFFSATVASAYWVWTPESKKFINPKYAVKDSPKEQYDYAMEFYDAKDYKRAAAEFEKLTKNYEFSEYAGMAQYHVGLSYENMGKYYRAFEAYQKAIDNFPHIDNVDEIIAREFNIAGLYESKENPKVLGTDIMTSTDRIVEIYRKVVDNAPYGPLAEEALFSCGQVLKKVGRYEEAIPEFQRILDEYPDSDYTERARYEVAYCAYKGSLKPAYDQETTDKALKAFAAYSEEEELDPELAREAEKTIQRLKDRAAEKSLLTAQFYERIHKRQAAIIYYQDILDRYPDCSYAEEAREKVAILSGAKRPEVEGGIFGFWSVKAPPAPATVAPEAPPVVAAIPPQTSEKKSWWPFGRGKSGAVPAAARTATAAVAPLPAWNCWWPQEPATIPPYPQASLAPVPGSDEAVAMAASASPVVLPDTALPEPVLTAPAAPAVTTVAPVVAPVAQKPLTMTSTRVSSPAAAAAGTAVAKKKRSWSPLGWFGLGESAPPSKKPEKVAVASAPAEEGPLPVSAVEPARGGRVAVVSPDDINVEKELDQI